MEQAATVFGLILLALLVVLPLMRPQLSLVSWSLMFPLEQLLQGAYSWFLANTLFVNGLIACSMGLAALRMVVFGGVRLSSLCNFGTMSIVLILLYAMVTILWSADQSLAVEFLGNRGPYLLIAIFIAPLTIRDISSLREVRWWILSLGCLLGIALYGAGTFRFYGARMVVMLGAGVRGNPLAVAEFGGLMFVLGVMSRDARGLLPTILRVGGGLLGAGLILSSGSRGQLLAVVFACAVCFPLAVPLRNPRMLLATAVGIPLVAGLILLSLNLFVSSENTSRWTSDSIIAGSEDRLSFISRYFGIWIQSPISWIFGLGTLSFGNIAGGMAGFVENLAAEILFEEGVFMFALFIALWIVLVRRISTDVTSSPSDIGRRTSLLMCFAVCLFFLAVALKSYCVWSSYPLWLWLGLSYKFLGDDQQGRGDSLGEVTAEYQEHKVVDA
jgi:hypothetical protein